MDLFYFNHVIYDELTRRERELEITVTDSRGEDWEVKDLDDDEFCFGDLTIEQAEQIAEIVRIRADCTSWYHDKFYVQ